MKNYTFTINGNKYNVEIKSIDDNVARIEVNGTKYDVEIQSKISKTKTPKLLRPVSVTPAKPEIDKKDRAASTPVIAPLPGTIIQIFVKPGDIVNKGQKILVMEAMKMENQVLADTNGVIETVKVVPGQTVLQGDTLIELI